MKNPPFDSLVWGSLRLAPITRVVFIVCNLNMNTSHTPFTSPTMPHYIPHTHTTPTLHPLTPPPCPHSPQ